MEALTIPGMTISSSAGRAWISWTAGGGDSYNLKMKRPAIGRAVHDRCSGQWEIGQGVDTLNILGPTTVICSSSGRATWKMAWPLWPSSMRWMQRTSSLPGQLQRRPRNRSWWTVWQETTVLHRRHQGGHHDHGGIGDDEFQWRSCTVRKRNTDAGVGALDVFVTIPTTRGFLSNGISESMTINGGPVG